MTNNFIFTTATKGNSIQSAESAERAGLLRRLVKANGELIPEQQAEHSTASHYALPEVHRYRERDIGALI